MQHINKILNIEIRDRNVKENGKYLNHVKYEEMLVVTQTLCFFVDGTTERER